MRLIMTNSDNYVMDCLLFNKYYNLTNQYFEYGGNLMKQKAVLLILVMYFIIQAVQTFSFASMTTTHTKPTLLCSDFDIKPGKI